MTEIKLGVGLVNSIPVQREDHMGETPRKRETKKHTDTDLAVSALLGRIEAHLEHLDRIVDRMNERLNNIVSKLESRSKSDG